MIVFSICNKEIILNPHFEFCLPRIFTNKNVLLVKIRGIRGDKNYNVVY